MNKETKRLIPLILILIIYIIMAIIEKYEFNPMSWSMLNSFIFLISDIILYFISIIFYYDE